MAYNGVCSVNCAHMLLRQHAQEYHKIDRPTCTLLFAKTQFKGQVIYYKIIALFLQHDQNLTTECHLIYPVCTSNCYKHNLTDRLCKLISCHILVSLNK